jgi:hypothetical protein
MRILNPRQGQTFIQDGTAMGLEGTIGAVIGKGRCVAAGQRIGTAKGAVTVEQLAAGAFEAICYDSGTRRFLTKSAKVSSAGRKAVVRLHTDKGPFEMTAEQRVLLENGGSLVAGELTPGTRLRACEVKPEVGYLVRSADFGREHLDLEHLTPADCAVANWYPVPSVDQLGEAEVYMVEVTAGGAQPNVVLWTVGPGGGIGIAIAV